MRKRILFALAFVILLTLTACDRRQEGNKGVIKEPDKSIPVIDKEEGMKDNPFVTVDKIIEFDLVEISDWLDENNIVVAMENKDLKKMSLEERSDLYSRGIYLYNIETKEIKPLRVRENMFLGGAKLSPDKRHLLYQEYSIGDNAFFCMSMDENSDKDIKDTALGLAITAKWTDDNNIIGVSYAGGAYRTDEDWKLISAYDLQDEYLYTLEIIKDRVYYISIAENLDMYILDLKANDKRKSDITNADGIIPSPDGEQLLITQSTEADRRLHIVDKEGNIIKTLAVGDGISGVSWSPKQTMIAYQLSSKVNGVDSGGLYIYDISSGETIRIADDVTIAETVWSPSGDKLALSQYSDNGYIKPRIIYLNKQ